MLPPHFASVCEELTAVERVGTPDSFYHKPVCISTRIGDFGIRRLIAAFVSQLDTGWWLALESSTIRKTWHRLSVFGQPAPVLVSLRHCRKIEGRAKLLPSRK